MDEKFENWKAVNKEFCDKANEYEIQCLYATTLIINELRTFKRNQENFTNKGSEVDINKIINRLSSIRSHLRYLKKDTQEK